MYKPTFLVEPCFAQSPDLVQLDKQTDRQTDRPTDKTFSLPLAVQVHTGQLL